MNDVGSDFVYYVGNSVARLGILHFPGSQHSDPDRAPCREPTTVGMWKEGQSARYCLESFVAERIRRVFVVRCTGDDAVRTAFFQPAHQIQQTEIGTGSTVSVMNEQYFSMGSHSQTALIMEALQVWQCRF